MALGESRDRSGAESAVLSCISAYPAGSLAAIMPLVVVARSLVCGGQYDAAQLMALTTPPLAECGPRLQCWRASTC